MGRGRDPAVVPVLALDPGVLAAGEVLEIYGWRAAAAHGGLAVLPHRGEWMRASQSGVAATSHPDRLDGTRFRQAVVHLQKSRDATWHGLLRAWERLEDGGRLVVVGGNELGVKSAVKRLESELGQDGEVVANRARGRAVSFVKREGVRPFEPSPPEVILETARGRIVLSSAPGVFSADRLDPGSGLLLDHLDGLDDPEHLFDPGCGIGVLGLVALARFGSARATLADADRRAVEAARSNATRLALADRCRVAWWDARTEVAPAESCDLVLCNPPFHSGKAVDLAPARAIFRSLETVLAPGGTALVVTLRTLPFEAELRRLGRLDQVAGRSGYKLLRIRR